MQEITIIGNIGRDAQVKATNSSAFATFSVAVTEKYKDKDEVQQERTTWYDVIHKNVELAKYVKKGEKIFVRGALKPSLYKDKDNQTKLGLSISSNFIQLLSNKKEEEKVEGFKKVEEQPVPASDDLPF